MPTVSMPQGTYDSSLPQIPVLCINSKSPHDHDDGFMEAEDEKMHQLTTINIHSSSNSVCEREREAEWMNVSVTGDDDAAAVMLGCGSQNVMLLLMSTSVKHHVAMHDAASQQSVRLTLAHRLTLTCLSHADTSVPDTCSLSTHRCCSQPIAPRYSNRPNQATNQHCKNAATFSINNTWQEFPSLSV